MTDLLANGGIGQVRERLFRITDESDGKSPRGPHPGVISGMSDGRESAKRLVDVIVQKKIIQEEDHGEPDVKFPTIPKERANESPKEFRILFNPFQFRTKDIANRPVVD